MTGKSKDHPTLAALVANVSGQPIGSRISRKAAAEEIAEHNAVAMMTLYGLCATGDVRWVDATGEVLEEDDLTVANFSGKLALIDADDLRDWLVTCSHDSQLSRKEEVIRTMIVEGNTPRKLGRKVFCDRVREACNWREERGFGDRTIMRLVKGLGQK